MNTCSIDSCDAATSARGWCRKHYRKWQDYGDPEAPARRHHGNPSAALAARVKADGDHLVWSGPLTETGYGKMWDGERVSPAHRVAWVLANGPIPDGALIDHACHNRACVKVGHLRLATPAQNNRNRRSAPINSTTGFRNVRVVNGRYRVDLQLNGSKVYGGEYRDLEDAREAAHALRLANFGAFAGNG